MASVDLPAPPFSLPTTMIFAAMLRVSRSSGHMAREGESRQRVNPTRPRTTGPCRGRAMDQAPLPVARTVAALRDAVTGWRAAGERVALVPTMGALHAGHLALVDLARTRADRVVASVFVNPAQFAPGEDFESYPRTFAEDARKLAEARCDLLYAPTAGA